MSILLKDNCLSFLKIGRNLKFDHGKAFKIGDKVWGFLGPKCDFWDLCDILDPFAGRFVVTNSRPELDTWHWDRIWDSTNFFIESGGRI